MSSKLKKCPSCGEEVAKSAKVCPHCGKKLRMGWFLKILVFFTVLIIIFIAAIKLPSLGKEDIDISMMKISNLKPTGEIVKALSITSEVVRKKGSIAEEKAHDKELKARRDKVIEEYTGKIIQWRLKVSHIEKDGEEYEITTSRYDGNIKYATTSITLIPKNDTEKTTIESIKPGDYITFKGKVYRPGFSVDLVIYPAILISVNGKGFINTAQKVSTEIKAQKNNKTKTTSSKPMKVTCKLTNIYDIHYNEIKLKDEDKNSYFSVFEISSDEKTIHVSFRETKRTFHLYQDDEYDTPDNTKGDRRRIYNCDEENLELETIGENFHYLTIKTTDNYLRFGDCLSVK